MHKKLIIWTVALHRGSISGSTVTLCYHGAHSAPAPLWILFKKMLTCITRFSPFCCLTYFSLTESCRNNSAAVRQRKEAAKWVWSHFLFSFVFALKPPFTEEITQVEQRCWNAAHIMCCDPFRRRTNPSSTASSLLKWVLTHFLKRFHQITPGFPLSSAFKVFRA